MLNFLVLQFIPSRFTKVVYSKAIFFIVKNTKFRNGIYNFSHYNSYIIKLALLPVNAKKIVFDVIRYEAVFVTIC